MQQTPSLLICWFYYRQPWQAIKDQKKVKRGWHPTPSKSPAPSPGRLKHNVSPSLASLHFPLSLLFTIKSLSPSRLICEQFPLLCSLVTEQSLCCINLSFSFVIRLLEPNPKKNHPLPPQLRRHLLLVSCRCYSFTRSILTYLIPCMITSY